MVVINSLEEREDLDPFTQIYHTYFAKLYNYIYYRVGEVHVTDDLVSEVFSKVIEKYQTYDPEKGKFKTWLFTIAHNTVINFYKKNSYNKYHLELSLAETVESGVRIEDEVVNKELQKILSGAVMVLDEPKRSIIALKFGGCLTNRQIAEVLQMSESNVGTIIHRALKELKGLLNEQGYNIKSLG